MTHPDSTYRTPRGLALAPLLVASTFGLLAPRQAAAQSEAPDCIAIVAEMLTPTPSAGAIRASAGCPLSGPVTLANRWTRRGARSGAERTALVEASALTRDGRLYDAVLGITTDESRPLADRLAGIRVLLGYAGDGVGFGVTQQGQAQSRDAKPAAARTERNVQPSPMVDGSVPFPSTMRADVKRELYRLANNDRDPDVRYAAQKASASLGYVVRKGEPVEQVKAP
jgi:hypothetical protein